MTGVKIFHSSTGDLFAFPVGDESYQVGKFFGVKSVQPEMTTRIDAHGAVTYICADRPDRWCRTYPTDHPDIPKPTYFGQKSNHSHEKRGVDHEL